MSTPGLRRELRDELRRGVEHRAARLIALSHDVHAHPEIAWEEVWSSARVAAELADAGFTIDEHLAGLPTAFAATRGSGPLRVALCAEYDALPGLGHACGHNIIAAAAVGAAATLAALADDLGLTVTVVGTPAEEGGGGKIELLERGVFDDIHAAGMVHPGPADVARPRPYAVSHSHIRYDGRTAHAATYPEVGINAADALTVAQVAIGLLRQQLPDSVRVHGISTYGGAAPNAIPSRAEGRWYVRAESLEELANIQPRVEACFRAGALASGAELSITAESKPYAEFRNHEALLAAWTRHAERLGRGSQSGHGALMSRASTDMGNLSRVVPSLHPYIGIDSLPAVNHQPEFADAAVTPAADRAILDGALGLAQTFAEAATDNDLRAGLLAGT
jgi:amidohydrolase